MFEAVEGARQFRIGIDVGGTFTKAVLIDNATRNVVARYSVKTTHEHERGVAAGVVEVFRTVLSQSNVSPKEVVFLAHSTTQATNALLEGDVAKVGVLGMAGEQAAKLAQDQVRIAPVELAPGRVLDTANRFLVTEQATPDSIAEAIEQLAGEGANVIVASSAFGVDNTSTEETVRELAAASGLLTTCGYEITRLYGLTTRTRTAVINASILPRMNATAEMTEASVREAGISAPLMIMRGDGGVMNISEMRRRPAMTMLSGPAASVAGALMHLRVSDGIYFEVGGTSTNIGVIRDGRPTITHARVGGHETYVTSLDVRVLGVAGGSLVRAQAGQLIDVGPRSAHIAGLDYAAFADPEDMVSPVIEMVQPKPEDAGDYVAVRCASGRRFALTTTCAANALGYTRLGMHAYAGPESALKAFAALGELIGQTPEAAARAVLECAAAKLNPVVQDLIREYRLDEDQCLLVGEGGGAGALVPFIAAQNGLAYEISRDAEVISSIGVALALVRDVVERVIPHPKPEDVEAVREEARQAVIRLGAHPKAVEVTVEVDRQTQLVRATAMGAAELHAKDPGGAIREREALQIAATSMDVAISEVVVVAQVPGFRIIQMKDQLGGRLRVIDGSGVIRLRRSAASLSLTDSVGAAEQLRTAFAEHRTAAGGVAHDELFMLVDERVVDLSGLPELDQVIALAVGELADCAPGAPVAVIAASPQRG